MVPAQLSGHRRGETSSPRGNGKQLLNGPYSTTILYIFFTLFGTIIIAAIFGTSMLRDFQRDTCS